jgi:hypothetical protein
MQVFSGFSNPLQQNTYNETALALIELLSQRVYAFYHQQRITEIDFV